MRAGITGEGTFLSPAANIKNGSWTDAKRKWQSKTPTPVIDLSAVAVPAEAEAEARETDKALKVILGKIGV